MEMRSLAAPPTADGRRLTGYAALFGVPSRVMAEKGKTFRETILPGAFARSLASGGPRGSIVALWDHGRDGRPPLARMPGTLRLWEDARGLAFEFEAPQSAADVVEAVTRGDVWGVSFGFYPPADRSQDRWSTRDGMPYRELADLDLLEISPTVHPAYLGTEIQARSAVEVPDPPPGLIRRAQATLELLRLGGA